MLKKRTTLSPNGTPDNVLCQELKRCSDDPIYFIRTYCKIQHPITGTALFDLYDYQAHAIKDYQSHSCVIQLAARQTGKTHVPLAYALWLMIFHPYKTVMYITTSSSMLFHARSIFEGMVSNLPSWIKLRFISNNKKEVMFDNFSSILFRLPSTWVGCGTSISLLILDEFAHIEDKLQRTMHKSLWPTILPSGSIIIASTRGSTNCLFDELWDSAQNQSNIYPIKWPWNIVPNRDPEHVKTMRNILSPEQWAREYECEHIATEPSFFQRLMHRYYYDPKDPINFGGDHGSC